MVLCSEQSVWITVYIKLSYVSQAAQIYCKHNTLTVVCRSSFLKWFFFQCYTQYLFTVINDFSDGYCNHIYEIYISFYILQRTTTTVPIRDHHRGFRTHPHWAVLADSLTHITILIRPFSFLLSLPNCQLFLTASNIYTYQNAAGKRQNDKPKSANKMLLTITKEQNTNSYHYPLQTLMFCICVFWLIFWLWPQTGRSHIFYYMNITF